MIPCSLVHNNTAYVRDVVSAPVLMILGQMANSKRWQKIEFLSTVPCMQPYDQIKFKPYSQVREKRITGVGNLLYTWTSVSESGHATPTVG